MSSTESRRIRRSPEEWQRLITEQADSGLTPAAFCQKNAISVASFQNWERRLAAETPAEPWFELGTLSGSSASPWEIELELGEGICLRLRRC